MPSFNTKTGFSSSPRCGVALRNAALLPSRGKTDQVDLRALTPAFAHSAKQALTAWTAIRLQLLAGRGCLGEGSGTQIKTQEYLVACSVLTCKDEITKGNRVRSPANTRGRRREALPVILQTAALAGPPPVAPSCTKPSQPRTRAVSGTSPTR